jgi:hypothetical protein
LIAAHPSKAARMSPDLARIAGAFPFFVVAAVAGCRVK